METVDQIMAWLSAWLCVSSVTELLLLPFFPSIASVCVPASVSVFLILGAYLKLADRWDRGAIKSRLTAYVGGKTAIGLGLMLLIGLVIYLVFESQVRQGGRIPETESPRFLLIFTAVAGYFLTFAHVLGNECLKRLFGR